VAKSIAAAVVEQIPYLADENVAAVDNVDELETGQYALAVWRVERSPWMM
jgi:hypothetical protein